MTGGLLCCGHVLPSPARRPMTDYWSFGRRSFGKAFVVPRPILERLSFVVDFFIYRLSSVRSYSGSSVSGYRLDLGLGLAKSQA